MHFSYGNDALFPNHLNDAFPTHLGDAYFLISII